MQTLKSEIVGGFPEGRIPHNSEIHHGDEDPRNGRHDETVPGGMYLIPSGKDHLVIDANGGAWGKSEEDEKQRALANAIEMLRQKDQQMAEMQTLVMESEQRMRQMLAEATAQHEANVAALVAENQKLKAKAPANKPEPALPPAIPGLPPLPGT